jgi:hypothetical protein
MDDMAGRKIIPLPLKTRDDLVTMRKPFCVRDLEDAMETCFRR